MTFGSAVPETPRLSAWSPHRPVVTATPAGYYLHPEATMVIRPTRSVGMILLGLWLILFGVQVFVALPIPAALSAALALIAGVLIILGM